MPTTIGILDPRHQINFVYFFNVLFVIFFKFVYLRVSGSSVKENGFNPTHIHSIQPNTFNAERPTKLALVKDENSKFDYDCCSWVLQ